MTMTKKLYYTDQYLRKFSSRVRRLTESNGKPAIVLDRTAFYPTSGGQPHDRGTINEIEVLEVIENESQEILHILESPVEGPKAVGRIYWNRRFDHMQQHTGQHLLSQAFIKKCNADTLSFHLGDESATLDLNQSGFSIDTIAAVEDFANHIIYENRRVSSRLVPIHELDQYPVRKPPVVENDIRIVEIENFDYSPCGGTHCSRTGEIGIVKITRSENYKQGTRIHFKCGMRALRDYQEKSKILKKIGDDLSTGEPELHRNIRKMREELKSLRTDLGRLKQQQLDQEAKEIFSGRKIILGMNIISTVFEDRSAEELKILAQKIVKRFPNTVVLFGTKAATKATLLFLRSEEIPINMGKLMQAACKLVNGRGGGRPQQAQGGGPAVDKLEMALRYALEGISKEAHLE